MIPLPGLEILIWMLRITAGILVFSIVSTAAVIVLARRRWRASSPAKWEHRISFGAVVWTFVWLCLNVGERTLSFALAPFLIALGGFLYVHAGNRKRGFENPGALIPGLWALSLAVAFLFVVGLILGIRADAEARRQAELVAEGQRNQDFFHALVRARDGSFVVVGTTSTPPNDADDAWVHAFDADGGQLRSVTDRRARDQEGSALLVLPDGSWLFAGRDEDHPFLAHAALDGTINRHRWSRIGKVAVLSAVNEKQFLLGGRASNKAWVALAEASGREHFSREVDTAVDHAEVSALATVGDRFVAAGSDSLFWRGAFLLGGTVAGEVRWVKEYRPEPNTTFQLAYVRARPDGTLVVLGRRATHGKADDLWLLHVSLDGRILGDITFGESANEWPGGLALRGDDILVAGHRFLGVDNLMWLRAMNLRGEMIWEKAYPEAGFGRAGDMTALPDGGMLVVGHRRLKHKSDAWIARFDRNGDLVWQHTYP